MPVSQTPGSPNSRQLKQTSTAKSVFTNHRKHRRVRVRLHGALCLSANQISLTHTLDMSEGGVSIANDKELKLSPGDEVKLQLEGIVSSGPQRNLDIYKMRVIYQDRDKLGLRFSRT